MSDYQKYINALRKCAEEHECDNTFTGQIIVSNLSEDTANLLETIEQEFDAAKAEIEQTAKDYDKFDDHGRACGLRIALQIIDKYKAEKEVSE